MAGDVQTETPKVKASPPWFSHSSREIARGIAHLAPQATDVALRMVKASNASVSFVVEAAGNAFFGKAFNPNATASRAMYEREIACRDRLKTTDLAPRLLFYSNPGKFLVTELVEGSEPADTPEPVCREIGSWYARFAQMMPKKTARSDWLSYLERHGLFADADVPEGVRTTLGGMPIAETAIARNDAHLSNFVICEERRLVGFDFEAARYKPVGWDILLTARLLRQRNPQRFEPMLDALLDGWAAGADQMDGDEFRFLADTFSMASLSREIAIRFG